MKAEHAHETQTDLQIKLLLKSLPTCSVSSPDGKLTARKLYEHSSTCCQQWLRAAERVASYEYLIL